LRLVYVTPDDRDTFNAFLERHPRGHPLQTWNWGEVKSRTGWQPLRLGVVGDDGEYIACASLLSRPLPGVDKCIFYAPRGPVLDWSDRRLVEFLLGGIQKLAEEKGAILLKIDPDVLKSEGSALRLIEDQGFRPVNKGKNFEGVQPAFVMRLDLEGRTPDELLADFHSKTRYNIRYAFRKGIEVRTECTRRDLDDFYDILEVTAERDEFGIRSREYFTYIWDQLVEHGYAKLVMAHHEGQPLAGAMAFQLGRRAWYVYGASSNEKRNLMPNYAVQWELIRWAKELGCHTYDFRGVSGNLDPEDPLYGLYRFKKGFDAELFELAGEFDLVYHPAWYWAWRTGEPLYRRIRSLLANWLH